MIQDKLAADILKALDIAILQRTGPYTYAMVGDSPAFYTELFPSDDRGPCTTPWTRSYLLEAFFENAEQFFLRGLPGTISSGVWQEEGLSGPEQTLLAEAMLLKGKQIVLLRQLKEEYAYHVGILRKAREQLLERRSLAGHLEILKTKAEFDGLTKTLNREAFMELLAAEVARISKTGGTLALSLLDIDNFKAVNDAYGHLAGDQVLAATGRLLRANLRREDVVGRYGGDEFIMYAPFSMPDQTCRIAEKLRNSVMQQSFGELSGITVSIGCTTYLQGESVESLIQRADLALYDAKRAGRNSVRLR